MFFLVNKDFGSCFSQIFSCHKGGLSIASWEIDSSFNNFLSNKWWKNFDIKIVSQNDIRNSRFLDMFFSLSMDSQKLWELWFWNVFVRDTGVCDKFDTSLNSQIHNSFVLFESVFLESGDQKEFVDSFESVLQRFDVVVVPNSDLDSFVREGLGLGGVPCKSDNVLLVGQFQQVEDHQVPKVSGCSSH